MREKQDSRWSNVELLRLVAMVLIVAHHYSLYGGFAFPEGKISGGQLWIQFLQMGGKAGSNLFVLITGYFLTGSSGGRIRKVLLLWIRIVFYSLGFYLLFVATGQKAFALRKLVKHLAPVTFAQWWFASTYFVLFLLSPFLARLLRSLGKREYLGALALFTVCWSVIPALTGRRWECNKLLWFLFLYNIGAYLRLWGGRKEGGGKWLALAGLLYAAMFALAVLFDVLALRYPALEAQTAYFNELQNFPSLVFSVLLFWGFVHLPLGHSRGINTLSPAMFGVYLIHEDVYVRPFLWKKLFQSAAFSGSGFLPLHSLGAIAAVLAGCTLLELARIHLLERHYAPAIERLAGFLEGKLGG